MRKQILWFGLFVAVFFVGSIAGWSAPFTPGNLVLADATNDRLIEVKLDIANETGEVVQIVTWPLGDMQRRRPLGFDFDPIGNCYVGVTGVPQSATELVQFPNGVGQIIRIAPDGTQTFHGLPPADIDKITVVSSFHANEVYVMRNTPLTPPTYHFRVRFQNGEISEITKFLVSATTGSFGEVLELADGTILIPLHDTPKVNIYGPNGGEPIGSIPTSRGYISFAYSKDKNYMLALANGQKSVDKVDFEGNVLDTLDFGALDGVVESWNVIFLGDNSDKFVLAEKTQSGSPFPNSVFIYDAADMGALPKIISLDLDLPSSLFDFHFVPEKAVPVLEWALY